MSGEASPSSTPPREWPCPVLRRQSHQGLCRRASVDGDPAPGCLLSRPHLFFLLLAVNWVGLPVACAVCMLGSASLAGHYCCNLFFFCFFLRHKKRNPIIMLCKYSILWRPTDLEAFLYSLDSGNCFSYNVIIQLLVPKRRRMWYHCYLTVTWYLVSIFSVWEYFGLERPRCIDV